MTMTAEQALARYTLVHVVRPTLTYLEMGGLAAEQLVLGTGIQESRLYQRSQSGDGPALGLWQMELATFQDLATRGCQAYGNFAEQSPKLLLPWEKFSAGALALNDYFACAFCRLKYKLLPAALPTADDLPALAAYWKRGYNTPLGAGTEAQFILNWHQFVTQDTFV